MIPVTPATTDANDAGLQADAQVFVQPQLQIRFALCMENQIERTRLCVVVSAVKQLFTGGAIQLRIAGKAIAQGGELRRGQSWGGG
jgi:hypothetical protein